MPISLQPHSQMTAETVAEYDVVLCVGDTTFLDYGSIAAKKEGYGAIGKGGNGLILHSALAIEVEKGQSLGILWQKLWNREPKQKLPKDETPTQKKKRQAAARKKARNRPFEQKVLLQVGRSTHHCRKSCK
ncbi:hypothetical protein [Nostoc sp.]|uniref:hypothetical protein n=1 Tax=Nostoc sp. TaxID=1180 RepID=UPI002FF6EA1F